MKEGKLSSALQERYGISEENAVGKVLWHSLNENAQIGAYDMKFGDTIIRNLTESDIENQVSEEHEIDERHGVQRPSDAQRGKKR
tara:strand:- start:260 stop:514 length:255 start_codon:yes stop_codon:yes gene_type:complete